MIKSVRFPFFDNVKFLLILLVVFGHTLPSHFSYPLERGIYNFIFGFHMPLFVFISGFFTKIDNQKKFFKGLFKILETLICFQIIHLLLRFSINHNISLKAFIEPGYTLWYLLCIIYWRIAIYVFKPSTKFYTLLLVSFLLFIMSGFIPVNTEFSFQRSFFFFPFFCLGYYSNSYNFVDYLQKIPFNICLLLFFSLLALSIFSTYLSVPHFVYDQKLLYGNCNYYCFSYPIYFTIAMRIIYLFFAVLLSICFMRIIPTNYTVYTYYGKDTLLFYIYHSLLIVLLRYMIDYFDLPKNIIWLLSYAIIIIIILFIVRQISLSRVFLNPISNAFTYIHHQ